LQGNSPVTIGAALNHYLKNVANVSMSWNDDNFNLLPADLPKNFKKTYRVKNSKYTYHINVCTLGYSFTWWDWNRWEKHLDWMNLKGINLPLAFVG